ncbi:MAG: hypothetical protein U0R64_08205 [Candidatus Nanopelagicales bacterium]
MTIRPTLRRLGALMAALTALTLVVGQAGASAAQGKVQASDAKSVIFLGDSVTAGFGYLGAKENAKNISGSVNSSFANSWYFGDNSLSDCNPPSSGTPDDRCSNNNFNGAPWSAGPWKAGANAPDVAYSFQIAASQDPAKAAPVENWAVTGSTPANWDEGGAFNYQLRNIKDTYVVMTLGANPILASFLKIRLSGVNVTNGACADSTEWLGWTGWWAYPVSHVVECADQQWTQNRQNDHLVNIYKTLLQNNNKVLAMGYYRACPWSFGVWQPNGNVANGPASGNSCPSQTEKVSSCSSCKVDGTTSQWDQAVGAQDAMNRKIESAVAQAQLWAKNAPGVNPADLQFVLPDQSEWAKHQAWSDSSWIFKNDTWIHPSKAGHTQLAKTVTGKMCSAFAQWCGAKPAWDTTPQLQLAKVPQAVTASVPHRARNSKIVDLPTHTKQKSPLAWTSKTKKVCSVFEGDLVTTRKDGKCKLRAYAAPSGKHLAFRHKYAVAVR